MHKNTFELAVQNHQKNNLEAAENLYKKILKKLPFEQTQSALKYLVFLGLLVYWGIILMGTFLNLY